MIHSPMEVLKCFEPRDDPLYNTQQLPNWPSKYSGPEQEVGVGSTCCMQDYSCLHYPTVVLDLRSFICPNQSPNSSASDSGSSC